MVKGVPLLNFEEGPRVPLLNLGESRVPILNFEGGSRSQDPGSRGPGPTFTPCQKKNGEDGRVKRSKC